MKYDNPEHDSFSNANIIDPDTEVSFHDEQTISIDEHSANQLVPPTHVTTEPSPSSRSVGAHHD